VLFSGNKRHAGIAARTAVRICPLDERSINEAVWQHGKGSDSNIRRTSEPAATDDRLGDDADDYFDSSASREGALYPNFVSTLPDRKPKRFLPTHGAGSRCAIGCGSVCRCPTLST
jgi:hypothetical protein